MRIAAVIAVLLGGVAVLAAGMQPGMAHGWYPKACCNDQDCFRADEFERRADGSLAMRAGPIHVIVPAGFAIQPSRDADAHVCVWRDGVGRYHARCVFLPGIG
jgi:hypothetical protein